MSAPVRMPHNQELEQAILAHVMTHAMRHGTRRAVEEAEIHAEQFYDPLNQAVWDALVAMAEKDRAFTYTGLMQVLEALQGTDTDNSMHEYVGRLIGHDDDLFELPDLGYAVTSLRELAVTRGTIEICRKGIENAQINDPRKTAADRLEELERGLSDLAAQGSTRKRLPTLLEIQRRTDARLEQQRKSPDGIGGIPTGLTELDKRLKGLKGGQVIIAAGRPGMGKTALGTNIGVHATKCGFPVQMMSLEMPDSDLYQRLYAMEARIDMDRQGAADLSMREYRELAEAALRINALPLFIDDTGKTFAEIRAEARRAHRRGQCSLLVIDYLGLIINREGSANRVHAIEETTSGCKRLAKELDIPILLLCQLNRGVEGREDRRPTLADLRDSGAIEQDADVVMFVYREEYYLGNQNPGPKDYESWCQKMDAARGVGEIITAKFRQGRTGIDRVAFDGASQTFSDLPAWR